MCVLADLLIKTNLSLDFIVEKLKLIKNIMSKTIVIPFYASSFYDNYLND